MLTLYKVTFLLSLMSLISPSAGQSVQPVFSINISTPREVVASGAEVKVKIVLKNITDHKIMLAKSVGEDQGELHHDILVRDEHANLAPAKKRASNTGEAEGDLTFVTEESMVLVPLKPGDVLTDGIIVSKAYDMSKPGKYTIQAERKDDESGTVVKSNTVVVTITP